MNRPTDPTTSNEKKKLTDQILSLIRALPLRAPLVHVIPNGVSAAFCADVMAAAGAMAGWILTLFAKTAAWSPMQLLSAGTLLNLRTLPEDYKKAALAALVTGLAAFGSALLASRKQNAL